MDDPRIRIILLGQLGEELPVQRSQLVRIFTSSTFTDTSVERNALMREIYPRLKDYCKSRHGLQFQVIDMRWGVRDEATDDHMTSELCMKEIAACQRLSVGPNFVTFLCQKYGYRPFPPKIPAPEFEILREALVENSKPVDLLDEWFLRDENCLPPVYILQPISSKLPYFNRQDEQEKMKADQGKWWNTFETIQSQLKFAAKTCNAQGKLTDEQARKFIISVTQDEVTHGILEASGNREEHCVCFIRKFENLKSQCAVRSARSFVDVVDGKVDIEAQELLDNLRDSQVTKALPQNNIFVTDLAEWTEEGVDIKIEEHQKYLTGFLDTFYKKIISMIDAAVAKEKQECISNPLYDDILQHLSFCKTKCSGFQGREDVLQEVKNYVGTQAAGEVRGSPLVLYGESGSGKTSVLAKCVSLVSSDWLNKTKVTTIVRFLGTSPSSTSIRRVLRSLCQQIQDVYNEGDSSDVPEDYLKLVTALIKNMRLATADKPLVIFLDSLDQLSSENGAHRMTWIPKVLPEHVALIVSTLPREHNILDALKYLLPKTTKLLQVAPFTPEKSTEVIHSWLKSANKAVTTQQQELVEQVVKACSLPLFLKLVFDDICRWHSYRQLEECILHSSVSDMISLIFDRLEDYHGKMLVSRALAYITLSPNGLAESELEDLLSLDDDVLNDVYQFWLPPVRRIPPSLWTRARSDISSYLVEREADGANVIYWYHRQFIETARKRYLDDDIVRKALHVKCAEYFQGVWASGRKKPCKYSERQVKMFSVPAEAEEDRMVAAQPLTFKGGDSEEETRHNLRKLTQLPFHLTEAEEFESLKLQVLCNYDFISCKLRALSIQEVMGDFERLQEKHFDEEVDYIGDSLRLSASVIAKDPDQLAPELVGRLACAVDKYPNIKVFVEKAREVCNKTYPLTPVNTCLQPPGGLLLTSLEGHTDAVVAVQVTSDSRLVVTGSKDNTAKVWTLDNGTLLHTLEGHREAVYGIEITQDNQQVVTYSHNGEYMKSGKICVWNLETGDQIHRLKGHTGTTSCNVALSCDGLFAVSGFETKESDDSDDEDSDYEDDIKEIRELGMTNKKRKLKLAKFSDAEESEEEEENSEEEDNRDDDDTRMVVVVWSMETGNLLHWLLGHEGEINGVLPLEENGRQIGISYSSDYTMIFWDLEKGEVIRRVEDHKSFGICLMQVSQDRRHLAVYGGEVSIHRPDGKYLFEVSDPDSSATVVAFHFTRDKTRVIGGHQSGEIKVFGMGIDGFEQTLIKKIDCDEDRNPLVDMVVTTDDKWIIATTGQENAFVYSVDTLELIMQLPHITTIDKLTMTTDGARVLTASGDKNVRVWDITKVGKTDRALTIDKHSDNVTTITLLHKQDQAITTAYQEKEFKVWDLKTGILLKSPAIPNEKSCDAVAITSDDRQLVGAGGYGLYILQLPDFKLLNTFHERSVRPTHFVLTPDNNRLVAGIGQPEFSIRIFDLSSMETLVKINLRSTDMQMLPNGNFLNQYYTQFYDKTGKTQIVQMIDSNSGQVVHEFKHSDQVLDYAVSSDYSMMACGCKSKDVDLWHLESLSHIATLEGHSDRVLSVSFTPDCQKIASGAAEGEVILWSVESRKVVHSLNGHESDISRMTFSSDSKRLFTCAENDLYVIVWCVETGKLLMKYNTYSVPLEVCFSTLSNTLVTGLQDGRIMILGLSQGTSGRSYPKAAIVSDNRKAETEHRAETEQHAPPKEKDPKASSPKRATHKNKKSSLCSLI